MKIKKWFSAFLAMLMVLSLCLAGCAGEEPEQTEGPTGTQPTGTQPTGTQETTVGATEGATTQMSTSGETQAPTQAPTPAPDNGGGNGGGSPAPAPDNGGGNGGGTPAPDPGPQGGTTEPTGTALVIGSNTAKPKNADGQCFTWTATQDSTLVLTMPEGNWAYWIKNLTSGMNLEKHTSKEGSAFRTGEMPVLQGDTVQVYVATASGVQGTVKFTAELGEAKGTKSNPYTVSVGDVSKIAVPAGKTVHLGGMIGGAAMTVSNAATAKVVVPGSGTYTAAGGVITVQIPHTAGVAIQEFTIQNTGSTTAVYEIQFTVAQGTSQAPAALAMGNNTAVTKAGAAEGYYFIWTPAASGTLTLTLPAGQNWLYKVDYLNSRGGSVQKSSEDDGATNVIQVSAQDLKKGESVKIEIALTDANGNIVEGSLTFTAEFK